MKRVKCVLLVFSVLLLYPLCVSAESCDAEDIARIKAFANNLTPKYTYIGDINGRNGLQEYLVSFDFGEFEGMISYHESYRSGFMEIRSLDGSLRLESGDRSIDLFYDNCGELKIATIPLYLPRFNEYSLRDECSDLKGELEICDSWYQGKIKDSSFLKIISNYRLEKEKKEFNILRFLSEHYLIVGGVSVFLIILVITIFVIRYRKYSRLD